MITVFGEGGGFRVVWLLEEMGLAYQLRPVDLLAGVEEDAEFLAVNPAGFIPANQDGDVTPADIPVPYALELARRSDAAALGEAEQAYMTRTSRREACKRAMETCQATKAWAAEALGRATSDA